jgi:ribosomal protein S18 acetylase RimI-like enzyme
MSPAGDGATRRATAGIVDRAEEFVYQLNERNHWIFRAWDFGNEAWARLVFRGLRKRAAQIDAPVKTRTGAQARFRFLTPLDDEAFARLLASFSARYLPPHALDRAAAGRALRRISYVPFGIFVEDRLVGYLLLRLFFPRRIVTGIWTLPETHNLGLGQECLRQTAAFSRAEGIADYATIPIDNPNSVRMANAAGWDVIRTNRRFHVLLRDASVRE